METFSAPLALCARNSPVPGEFPAQRPVTRSFDVFFNLCLNKRLSKQSWSWWFETPSRSSWRHCNISWGGGGGGGGGFYNSPQVLVFPLRQVFVMNVHRVSNDSYVWNIWGTVGQKQMSRARTSNYIPLYPWDVITCPRHWYLLLTHKSACINGRNKYQYQWVVITCPRPWYLFLARTSSYIMQMHACLSAKQFRAYRIKTLNCSLCKPETNSCGQQNRELALCLVSNKFPSSVPNLISDWLR